MIIALLGTIWVSFKQIFLIMNLHLFNCNRLCFLFFLLLQLPLTSFGLDQKSTSPTPFELDKHSLSQIVKACTGCHGPQGRSTPYGYFPRIAGKPEAYLFNQLLNFQQGKRVYPQMSYLLDNLSPSYLHALAHFFATQEVPYPPPAQISVNESELALGKNIVYSGVSERGIPACASCHAPTLTGVAPSTPGLLGLPRDYLIGQLGAWRTHQRGTKDPDCMAQTADKLSVQEISAVTAWLASQPWPKGGRPVGLASLPKPPPLECGSVPNDKRATMTASASSSASAAASTQPATLEKSSLNALQLKGEYLTRIGNCQACHTPNSQESMVGGRAVDTPFGQVYSSNLTPDPQTGLGNWTADDFWRAIHDGRSKDGHLLSPAFPFTELTLVSRSDSDAMWAYLRTLAPKRQAQIPNTLTWPYNTQIGLFAWRWFYFKGGEYVPSPNQSQSWNRGAYLVNGLAHCTSCHTPRNFLGASRTDFALSGATLNFASIGKWYAPSLLNPIEAGVQHWSKDEIQNLLKNASTPQGYASGPMAEVVYKGTQYLSVEDTASIATYLQSLTPNGLSSTPLKNFSAPTQSESFKSGEQIYVKHCEGCHGKLGEGVKNQYPALSGNRNVSTSHLTNLVQSITKGGIPPTTIGHPAPYGMPPYRSLLSDKEVAEVLTFIRGSWGNRAAQVSTLGVIQSLDTNKPMRSD